MSVDLYFTTLSFIHSFIHFFFLYSILLYVTWETFTLVWWFMIFGSLFTGARYSADGRTDGHPGDGMQNLLLEGGLRNEQY